jgi:hypothetical protein
MTNPMTADVAGPAREAYETPSILYREPLEAVAAVCVPGNPAKAKSRLPVPWAPSLPEPDSLGLGDPGALHPRPWGVR